MASLGMTTPASLSDLPPGISDLYLKGVTVSLKARQQGYKYFTESYYERVLMFKSLRDDVIQVSARCHRSQRKNEIPHSLNLDISAEKVDMAHCSCIAGSSGCCSHIVGLLIALQHWILMGLSSIPDELSSTSLPQQWSVPRGTKIEAEPVPQIVMVKAHPNRKQKPVENTLTECRKVRVTDKDLDHLKSLSSLPISYLVNTPQKTVDTQFGTVGIGSGLSTHANFYTKQTTVSTGASCGNLKFPSSTPPVCVPGKHQPLPQDCVSSHAMALEIEAATRGQIDSKRWIEERKTRMTASMFHEITRRKKFTEKYVEDMLNKKAFHSNATTYGRCNESKARQAYVKKTGFHVHDCGLVVNPNFSFIGGSPDGKVCDNGVSGIIEIKCPYSARDLSITEAINLPNFCLVDTENGPRLNHKHSYFCQVQGQLMVTGAPFCDFVVYTRKSLHIERILPCKMYMTDLLSKLCEIYFVHVRHHLLLHN